MSRVYPMNLALHKGTASGLVSSGSTPCLVKPPCSFVFWQVSCYPHIACIIAVVAYNMRNKAVSGTSTPLHGKMIRIDMVIGFCHHQADISSSHIVDNRPLRYGLLYALQKQHCFSGSHATACRLQPGRCRAVPPVLCFHLLTGPDQVEVGGHLPGYRVADHLE